MRMRKRNMMMPTSMLTMPAGNYKYSNVFSFVCAGDDIV